MVQASKLKKETYRAGVPLFCDKPLFKLNRTIKKKTFLYLKQGIC